MHKIDRSYQGKSVHKEKIKLTRYAVEDRDSATLGCVILNVGAPIFALVIAYGLLTLVLGS